MVSLLEGYAGQQPTLDSSRIIRCEAKVSRRLPREVTPLPQKGSIPLVIPAPFSALFAPRRLVPHDEKGKGTAEAPKALRRSVRGHQMPEPLSSLGTSDHFNRVDDFAVREQIHKR